MAAAPSLCVLRYFNSWNKNLRKEGLCSVLLRTSSLFARHYCSSNLVGDACATALRSPDLVALEYADLNLTHKVSEELGHVRIRQHVNPLSASFSMPADAPDWDEVFKDPTLPLMVDVGSGSGRFLLWLAKRNPEEKNYLGLEIRQKLVKRANFWVKELALSNIHFLFANATISFNQLVSTYPGPLMLVSILCPDPHFKKRHHKRRVVQKHLVDSIIKNLRRGGQNFGSLLMDFLYFFGNVFDPRQMRISVQGSGVYMKRERGCSIDPIHIDDPLYPTNNVGRNCFRIHQCIKAFSEAYSVLENELMCIPDYGDTCLRPPYRLLPKIIPSIDVL